ncbi:MAG: hypothetical protein ACIARQ_02325 [Phycisphaerales bacterium JB061]
MRSSLSVWATGLLLVALSAAITARPSLALATSGAFSTESTISSLSIERTYSNDLIPWSPVADDPTAREHQPTPGGDTSAPWSYTPFRATAGLAPASLAERPVQQARRAHAPRGPPTS